MWHISVIIKHMIRKQQVMVLAPILNPFTREGFSV